MRERDRERERMREREREREKLVICFAAGGFVISHANTANALFDRHNYKVHLGLRART